MPPANHAAPANMDELDAMYGDGAAPDTTPC